MLEYLGVELPLGVLGTAAEFVLREPAHRDGKERVPLVWRISCLPGFPGSCMSQLLQVLGTDVVSSHL